MAKVRGFKVKGTSTERIRATAAAVRPLLCPQGESYFDLARFLERLELFGISYDIVPDDHLPPGVEASCIPELRRIDIANSTYEDICRSDPRARFTLVHELGHLILAHSRSFHRDAGPPTHKPYEDSEWQADCFAAEFLMPLEIIKAKRLFTPWELQIEFNVSLQAAAYRLDNLRKRNEI